MNKNLFQMLSKQKILPIIRNDSADLIVNYVNALIEAELNIVEINVESMQVYEAIKEVSDKITVCAGGIITLRQAQAAIECGAKIISSPIAPMNLVKYSKDVKIPFIAGTSTANEAYQSWKSGIFVNKIYPITAMGGCDYLKNILRPMNFLKIVAQGDIKLSEAKNYIDCGAYAVGIGRDIFKNRSYSEIVERLKKTMSNL